MSDSLRDIVSIGQLTGETSNLTLSVDGADQIFDILSFTRDKTHIRALAFANREAVVNVLKADSIKAVIIFEGVKIGSGTVICVGYEPVTLGDLVHDTLLVHIKRDT